MDDKRLFEALKAGLSELQMSPQDSERDKLLAFIRLVEKWNRKFNLTGAKDTAQLLYAHVLDSLVIRGLLPDGALLDVGSGAGFPGIPLAIVEPDRQFELLDSNGKRTRFMQQAKTELGLENVKIAHARIEDFATRELFPVVVSRAVASVHELAPAILPLLAEGGSLLLMKGSEYADELEDIPPGLELDTHQTLEVPGKLLSRHVLTFRKNTAPESVALAE